MSMLDSFFNKGFKAAKCKTLLKLTVPRIKLLRNRREIQLKQMRRDIAKLLEAGQEATARIRVEHIIREEKMMAAQEIIELFCELIIVRLSIIEAQRECPLDLKEAISSVCFAAPRCADLPELLQVQMLCIAKYGKEFVAAATELMPECGVNRQLIELLSVRAPDPDVKLKLLKEIAEEHELDWDPAASENELLKSHEDLLVTFDFSETFHAQEPVRKIGASPMLLELVGTVHFVDLVELNGPTNFLSGSKLPLPKGELDESLYSASEQAPNEDSDSDTLDFPEVPKETVRVDTVSAPEMLPFPEVNFQSKKHYDANENPSHEPNLNPHKAFQGKSLAAGNIESPENPLSPMEDKQFVPFMSSPSLCSSSTFSMRPEPPPLFPRTISEANVDLQDVLAAAHAAADTAEQAAAAARSAASLAQMRISELVKKKKDDISDRISENPFHADIDIPHLSHQNSSGVPNSPSLYEDRENHLVQHQASSLPSYDELKVEFDSSSPISNAVLGHGIDSYQPQRLASMDDETYLSYPNLFLRQDSNVPP